MPLLIPSSLSLVGQSVCSRLQTRLLTLHAARRACAVKPSYAVGASVATPTETLSSAAVDSDGGVRVLDKLTAPERLKDIDTLIFDCDGVLWRGNEIIHNAPEALRAFRAQGKRLLFVTNNSSKSRAQYAAKFAGLGLQVDTSEIVSSSYAAAAYLRSVGLPGPGRRVLLLGWTGVEAELEEAGIPYLAGRHLRLPAMDNIAAMEGLELDSSIAAVVVGWDPLFDYARLVYASACLRELPGCATLVATNTDHADHIGRGRMMPGTGGLAAALETASGVKAVNVGKGGPWLLPYLCAAYGLDPSRTAIVGDRMDTDIALGRQGGLTTCLPLTGVTTLPDLAALPPAERPDVVVPGVAALAGLPHAA